MLLGAGSVGRAFALGLLALWLGACHTLSPPDNDEPTGPDEWPALRNEFRELVSTARSGNVDAVRARLEAYLLTEPEMVALLGPERAARVWPKYSTEVAADLRREAPPLIVRLVADGHVEIDIDRLGPARPQFTSPGNTALIEALAHKQPMFIVRLRKPEEVLGLRLESFLYFKGRWRALFRSYRYLNPDPEEEEADAPTADAPAADAAPATTQGPDGGPPTREEP